MSKGLKFVHNKIQKALIEETLESRPSFKKCFTTDLTEDFFDDLDNRINGVIPQHVVIFLYGNTGTFKSSVAQSIAIKFQPDFSAKQITFTDRQLLEMAPKSRHKDFFIRDESPKSFGAGSGRVSSQVHTLSETLRKRQNSLIFIRPVFENVGAAHYWLRTIDSTEDYSHVRLGVQNPLSQKFIGALVVEIIKDNLVWKAYELEKNKFIDAIARNKQDSSGYSALAEEVLMHPQFKDVTRKKQIKLLVAEVHQNLTVTEQDYVYEKILMSWEKPI